jgi:2-iminoacetate synthase ThiH
MSPPEITHLSKLEKRPVRDVLVDLKAAGLDSIPGGGAEILVERVRKVIAPKKATTDEWLEVYRQWAKLGGKGTATMMFGHVETDAERIEHMTRIRDLQAETGGVFTAFIPWTFQPENTAMGKATARRARRQQGDRRRVSAHAEPVAPLPAERAARAVELRHAGHEGVPDRPVDGRRRLRLGDARGERRQLGRLHAPDVDPRDRTPHQGRRLRAAAAQHDV